jgi:hypothetical protein
MALMTEETGKALLRALQINNELLRKNDEKWVKVSVIQKLTGWNKHRLFKARKSGEIQFKKKNGFWYNENSLNIQKANNS